MITSGSIALTANKEYGRYMIKCSTGETIPVDASGAPVGQVAFTFYKVDTDGVMASFSAKRVYYELLNSNGSSVYDDSLTDMSLLDVTDDLTNYRGQFKSVRLTVYGTDNEVLAVQSFGATEPGSDAEIYVISLTAAYYTVNGLKEINAKLAGKLYKRKGTTTTPVSGATVKFGYVNGSTTTALTDSSGAFDDSDWFVGDIYTDTSACNSSPSIFVSYELNGVTQASQYVSLAQQGGDGEPGSDGVTYDIVLNTGDTVPCTAYAELISKQITVYLQKNGTNIDFGIDLKIKDNNGDVLSSWKTAIYPAYQIQPKFLEAVATGKAPRSINIRALVQVDGVMQAVCEKNFSVTYESPVPFVRKETAWNSGLTFRNGDIILIGGKIDAGSVFIWNYPISGNSAVDPKTDITNNPSTTKWKAFDYFRMVATRILLTEYALVKNLGVEVIEMKDVDGNILFQAKGGAVTCNVGNFNNINVQSGKIAGFKISGNGLTNYPFDNDAYVIFRNDAHKCFAGIGGNVMPASSGMRSVGRFENEDTTDWWGLGRNIALLLSARGSTYNHAFIGNGHGSLDGFVVGYRPNIMRAPNSGAVIDYNEGNYVFIINYVSDTPGIILPRLTDIRYTLGIGSDVNFVLPLTICGHISTQGFKIVGRKGVTGQSSDYPKLRDKSTNDIDSINMAGGDVLKLLLVYDGGEYYAYTVSFNS